MANFASDNTSGVHPKILEALIKANEGDAPAYGADEISAGLTARLRDFFEHDALEVFPVFNGSGANSVAIASLLKSFEGFICHKFAHVNQDECGMPEFFSGGKALPLSGLLGKLTPEGIEKIVAHSQIHMVHHVRPGCVTITQATEEGTVYDLEEIQEIGAVCQKHALPLHMDGARFYNAVMALNCTPAEMTWKAGVDVLSLGGTKNGAMMAEAIVYFNSEQAKDAPFYRKQLGQLASKHRYLAVQIHALLEDDLWRQNATHANQMAQKLGEGIANCEGCSLYNPVQANEVFAHLPLKTAETLEAKGHQFYPWTLLGADVYRFVASFNTPKADVEAFLADLKVA